MRSRDVERLIVLAQKEAGKAIRKGNPPFGALLVDERGQVVARAHNTQHSANDPTGHAEINLLRKAGKRLKTCDLGAYRLVTNAEPCSMCLSAGVKANIRHYYYGAPHEPIMDPDLPAEAVAKRSKHPLHLHPGYLAESCARQIKTGRRKAAAKIN